MDQIREILRYMKFEDVISVLLLIPTFVFLYVLVVFR